MTIALVSINDYDFNKKALKLITNFPENNYVFFNLKKDTTKEYYEELLHRLGADPSIDIIKEGIAPEPIDNVTFGTLN